MDVTAEDEVLVEQSSGDPATGPFIRRLSPGGEYAEYTSVEATLRGGRIVTEPVEPAWRHRATLSADQLANVEEALRAGFFDLAGEYEPTGGFEDGYEVRWRAQLDGREHSVLLRAVDVADIPALAAVRDAFELAIGAAVAAAGARDRGD